MSISNGQAGYGNIDYLAKSNPVAVPPVNHQTYQTPMVPQSTTNVQQPINTAFQPSTYQAPMEKPIPTKDFTQINQFASSTSSYQTSQVNQVPKTTASFEPNKLLSQPPNTIKSAASYESTATKDLIYQPKVDTGFSSSSYQNPQVLPSNISSSKVDTFDTKFTSDLTSKLLPGGSQVTSMPNQTVSSGKRKPFGLNVSEEFTNSLTIKKMAEPFKSNVTTIKQRARQFRSSLTGYIK